MYRYTYIYIYILVLHMTPSGVNFDGNEALLQTPASPDGDAMQH